MDFVRSLIKFCNGNPVPNGPLVKLLLDVILEFDFSSESESLDPLPGLCEVATDVWTPAPNAPPSTGIVPAAPEKRREGCEVFTLVFTLHNPYSWFVPVSGSPCYVVMHAHLPLPRTVSRSMCKACIRASLANITRRWAMVDASTVPVVTACIVARFDTLMDELEVMLVSTRELFIRECA